VRECVSKERENEMSTAIVGFCAKFNFFVFAIYFHFFCLYCDLGPIAFNTQVTLNSVLQPGIEYHSRLE